MLDKLSIQLRQVSPRHHLRKAFDSRHDVVRSTVMRSIDGISDMCKNIAVQKATRTSNNHYGKSILSADELARGFSRPSDSTTALIVPTIVGAQTGQAANRKLTRIFHSKPNVHISFPPAELVELYVCQPHAKREKLSTPFTVLSFSSDTWTVTLPSPHGRTMQAVAEAIRCALPPDSFAVLDCKANDELDELH